MLCTVSSPYELCAGVDLGIWEPLANPDTRPPSCLILTLSLFENIIGIKDLTDFHGCSHIPYGQPSQVQERRPKRLPCQTQARLGLLSQRGGARAMRQQSITALFPQTCPASPGVER